MAITKTDKKTKLDYVVESSFLLLLLFFPFSIALRNIFLGLTFIFYVLNKLLKRDFSLPRTSFNKYIYSFFLLSILSMFKAEDLRLSIETLISPIFRYIVFYFIAMELIKKDNVKKYLNTLLAGNLLVISYGIYVDYFTGGDFFYRANGMGTLASFIVILFLSLLLSKKFGIYKRLILSLGIIGGTTTLITTYSRGAILGFFSAVIVGIGCIMWRSFKKRSNRRVKVFLISILVFTILVVPFLASDVVIKRFERIKNINANNSLRTRVAMWKSSLLMIKDNPLLGVGIGNFRSNFIYYLKNKLKIKISRVGISHEHPHNLFLYVGAGQGIISLIILLIIFFKGYKLGNTNYINFKSGTLTSSLGLALVGIITSLVIHSLVDTTARYGHVGFYVLLIAVLNLKLANFQEGTGR